MSTANSLEAALQRLLAGVARDSDLQALRQARITLATARESIALGGDITNSLVNIGGQVFEFKGVSPEALREALSTVYPPRLFQLPADLGDFTGREEEVAKLLAVLRGGEGKAAISALGGLGGVGKTALAVHAAHELAPDYPEAQIKVDLLGTEASPLSPEAAMGNVVKAFHPEARLPESFGEMQGLYHSVLAGKRALLLLDNARDGAQVRPLLPPAPWGVLVTSRRTIILPGVQPLNLDVLPEDEATELLETILGPGRARPGEVPDLAARCGRLPLALRVAGSFLAVHPDWTAAEYLTALADEKERLRRLKDGVDDVEAALGLSAAQLAREQPDLAARWQMLSVFPAGFDLQAATAVWEVEEPVARDNLSELLSRSLVLFDPDKSRYRLHDLMRPVAENAFGYAGAEPDRDADANRLAEAAFRHAAHYAKVLRASKELYKKGGEAIQAGLDLFDAEGDNIRAGQAWAAEHAGEKEEAARLCSDYPDAGVYVLDLRLHSRERIAWLTAALAAARRLQDRASEGAHLGNLGIAYWRLGDPRQAIELYEQRLVIAHEIGDRRGEGGALGSLGLAYFELGEPRRAIEYYEQHLAIAKEIGDRRGEGNALGNLGIAYQHLGEPRRAIEFYEQQLEITREIGDRRGESIALWNMSLALDKLGGRDRAIVCAEASLKIKEQIEDPWAEKVRRQLEKWRREG